MSKQGYTRKQYESGRKIMSKIYDVAIIGGGVIGSSVAHFLAERGYRVAIVEKQRIASEASKAAAGLLGVQAEWDEYDPLFELARKSRAIFPHLAEALREKTGIDIGYEGKGIYRIAQNENEATRLLHIMKWQQQIGEASHLFLGSSFVTKSPIYLLLLLGRCIIQKMVMSLHQILPMRLRTLPRYLVQIYTNKQKCLIFKLKRIK